MDQQSLFIYIWNFTNICKQIYIELYVYNAKNYWRALCWMEISKKVLMVQTKKGKLKHWFVILVVSDSLKATCKAHKSFFQSHGQLLHHCVFWSFGIYLLSFRTLKSLKPPTSKGWYILFIDSPCLAKIESWIYDFIYF